MTEHSKYCENCDKWLDSENDYTVVSPCIMCGGTKGQHNEGIHQRWERSHQQPPLSNQRSWIECNSCEKKVKDIKHVSSEYYEYCKCCGKSTVSKEFWEKAKPNWRKRFVIAHGQDEKGNITINHDCFVKCENNQGGKACGKKWKVNKDNYLLLVANNFSFFSNNACVDCRIKELEEQIAEARNQGKELTDEGKEYYEKLKKLVGKDDDDNNHRERERAKKPLRWIAPSVFSNSLISVMIRI